MKYKSGILSQASGSVAGLTFSHNAGGAYIRARSIPTNPNSTEQQKYRSITGTLSNVWQGLTAAQRADWQSYADAILLVDRLGESRKITALNHFIRSLTWRKVYVGGADCNYVAPTDMDIGATPLLESLTAVVSLLGVCSIGGGFNCSDAPAVAVDGNVVPFWTSPPLSPGVMYYKGPWNYIGWTAMGNAAAQPVTIAKTASGTFDIAGGQAVFLKCHADREDNRRSADTIMRIITTAAP